MILIMDGIGIIEFYIEALVLPEEAVIPQCLVDSSVDLFIRVLVSSQFKILKV